jgi:hypothetical protein
MSQDEFFDNPAIDRMMQSIVSLSRELYVTRDRLAVMERLLETRGVVTRADLEAYVPSAEEAATIEAERNRFIASIFDPMIRSDATS